jgi:hypothetical protein
MDPQHFDEKHDRRAISQVDSKSQINDNGANRTTGTSMKSTTKGKCFQILICMLIRSRNT